MRVIVGAISVFHPNIRGKTDQVLFPFRKPQ